VTAALASPVIRVRGLTKRYADVQAVDGIDFDVAKGEIFGLLGPNGAGKTTTVEILEGLREPDGGEVWVLGVDVRSDADAIKPRIGVSLQTAALYPKLTVTELVDLFRSFYPRTRPTGEIIDALELGERRDARSQELSGGQRQRLAVALSLVNDPELVFLDEPTTGLDPASRLTIWDELRRINERGTTVFLTTQSLEEADQLCDRLAIIDGGRIVREGTPASLKAELRERDGLDDDPSLDDVFLDATGRSRSRVAGDVQEVTA
jgi:ABC-2 type transport system ATP-binding protein